MKKIATLLPALIIVLAIASCGHKNEQQPIHKIGVIVYDLKDEQVQAFRQYMEGYLGKNFSDTPSPLPVFCGDNYRRRGDGVPEGCH